MQVSNNLFLNSVQVNQGQSLFERLKNSGIVDRSGTLLKTIDLPPLSEIQLTTLKTLLDRQVEVSIPGNETISFQLNDYLSYIQEKIAGTEIEFVGGMVRYVLFSDPNWFHQVITSLGCRDSAQLIADTIALERTFPPDFDIRFTNPENDDLHLPPLEALKFLQSKQSAESKTTLTLKNAFVKRKTICESENRFSIVTMGNNPQIESLFIRLIERDHLFLKDNIGLTQKGVLKRVSLQGLIDLLLKKIHVEKPESINHNGWPSLMLQYTKGYSCEDSSLELMLAKKSLDRKKETIETLLARQGRNHLDQKGRISFIFNACHSLNRFHPNEEVDRLFFSLVKNENDSKLKSQLLKFTQFKDLCHVLEMLALLSTPLMGKSALVRHRGDLSIRAEIEKGYFIYLKCRPLKLFARLYRSENQDRLRELDPQDFELSSANPSHLIQLGLSFDTIKGWSSQFRKSNFPFIKALAQAFSVCLDKMPPSPSHILQMTKTPAKEILRLLEASPVDDEVKEAIKCKIEELLEKRDVNELQTLFSQEKLVLHFSKKQVFDWILVLINKLCNEPDDKKRFNFYAILERALTLSESLTEQEVKQIVQALNKFWSPTRDLPKKLQTAITTAAPDWYVLLSDDLKGCLEFFCCLNSHKIPLDKINFAPFFMEWIPKMELADLIRVHQHLPPCLIKDQKLVALIIDRFFAERQISLAVSWMKKKEGGWDSDSLLKWLLIPELLHDDFLDFALKLFNELETDLQNKIMKGWFEINPSFAMKCLVKIPFAMKDFESDVSLRLNELPPQIRLEMVQKYDITEKSLIEKLLLEIFTTVKEQKVKHQAFCMLVDQADTLFSSDEGAKFTIWKAVIEDFKATKRKGLVEAMCERKVWERVFQPEIMHPLQEVYFSEIIANITQTHLSQESTYNFLIEMRKSRGFKIDYLSFDKKWISHSFTLKNKEAKSFALDLLADYLEKDPRDEWVLIVDKFIPTHPASAADECIDKLHSALSLCLKKPLPKTVLAKWIDYFWHLKDQETVYKLVDQAPTHPPVSKLLDEVIIPHEIFGCSLANGDRMAKILVRYQSQLNNYKVHLKAFLHTMQIYVASKSSLKKFCIIVENNPALMHLPGGGWGEIMREVAEKVLFKLNDMACLWILVRLFIESSFKAHQITVSNGVFEENNFFNVYKFLNGDKKLYHKIILSFIHATLNFHLENLDQCSELLGFSINHLLDFVNSDSQVESKERNQLLKAVIFSPLITLEDQLIGLEPIISPLFKLGVVSRWLDVQESSILEVYLSKLKAISLKEKEISKFIDTLLCHDNFFVIARVLDIINISQFGSLSCKNRLLLEKYGKVIKKMFSYKMLTVMQISEVMEQMRLGLYQHCTFRYEHKEPIETKKSGLVKDRGGKELVFEIIEFAFKYLTQTNNLFTYSDGTSYFIRQHWYPFLEEGIKNKVFTSKEYEDLIYRLIDRYVPVNADYYEFKNFVHAAAVLVLFKRDRLGEKEGLEGLYKKIEQTGISHMPRLLKELTAHNESYSK